MHQFQGRINPFFDDDGVSVTYFEMGSLPERDDEDKCRLEDYLQSPNLIHVDFNLDFDEEQEELVSKKGTNCYDKEIRYTIVEQRITELLGDCDNNNRESNAADQNDDLAQYNSYNYWRISPDTPLDPEIVGTTTSSKKVDNNNAQQKKLVGFNSLPLHS